MLQIATTYPLDEFVVMATVGEQSNEEHFRDINNHYHISIYNKTLDQVIRELKQCFSVESQSLI